MSAGLTELQTGVPALLGLVFALGMRHGLDADHVATIDAMARAGSLRRPAISRWTGCLFSLGHGAVVTLVAAAVSLYAAQWDVPAWLESFGAWVSITVLALLGSMNIHAVITAAPGENARLMGIKGRLFARMTKATAGHPALVMLVGALFAVSFDTMSQTAVFALAASGSSGWITAAQLGLVFTLGMMLIDGLNGWWVAGMIRRADRRANVISRFLCIAIGASSLLIAALGAARQFWSDLDQALEDKSLWLGVMVAMTVAAGFLFSLYLERRPAARSA